MALTLRIDFVGLCVFNCRAGGGFVALLPTTEAHPHVARLCGASPGEPATPWDRCTLRIGPPEVQSCEDRAGDLFDLTAITGIPLPKDLLADPLDTRLNTRIDVNIRGRFTSSERAHYRFPTDPNHPDQYASVVMSTRARFEAPGLPHLPAMTRTRDGGLRDDLAPRAPDRDGVCAFTVEHILPHDHGGAFKDGEPITHFEFYYDLLGAGTWRPIPIVDGRSILGGTTRTCPGVRVSG